MVWSALITSGLGALTGLIVSTAAMGPGTGDWLTRQLYNALPARIRSASDLISAYRKGLIASQEYFDKMEENGFHREEALALYRNAFDTLTGREALILHFKNSDNQTIDNKYTREWLAVQVARAGLDQRLVDDFTEANRPEPTVSDLVSFANRDVFEPEQQELVAGGEPTPSRYLTEMKKLGFSEEKAEWYWKAHWYVPSITQCFEMFQRLFDHPDPSVRFGETEMDKAFALADIAPGFRKRLKAISYGTINRVDIRRLYRSQVLGKTPEEARPKIVRLFRELGLSPKNAALMADFTIAYEVPEERDYSRSQILELYSEGILGENGREEAKRLLLELRYSEEETEQLLKLHDKKIISEEEQRIIDLVETQFLNGEIESEAQIRTGLSRANLTVSKVNSLIDKWRGNREKNRKRMSNAQADRALELALISEKEWQKIYESNGLVEKDIQVLKRLRKAGESEKRSLPPKQDLTDWLSRGLLTKDEFTQRMKLLGFIDEDIDLYLTSNGTGA
jgi:hypothetical protein